jgi:hypothetical protein
MISLVGLAGSLDSHGTQSAATPASISPPLPPGKASGQAIEPSQPTDYVIISSEGVRQLQHAAEREAEHAAARRAAGADAELAARMAHEMAYRREIIIVSPSAYGNLATSMYVRGISPATNAASLAKAQSELDQARLARIALYEYEKARGTPPAEIFDSLTQFDASRPQDQQIAVVY